MKKTMDIVKNKIEIIVEATMPKESMGDFYGIFFEDINHAADGGLYAEMIQNRSFEFSRVDNPDYRALTAWQKVEEHGRLDWMISTKEPCYQENPHFLTLRVREEGERVGVCNQGYTGGLYVEKGKSYRFSCLARGGDAAEIRFLLTSPSGKQGGEQRIWVKEGILLEHGWRHCSGILAANEDIPNARLELLVKGTETLDLDFVSLMPTDTYKGRRNGLRRDLAETLEDLKPRFMRFPGGCLVHDGSLESGERDSMYRWKNTIGDPARRPARRNNWGYNQTLGLGFYEYFQLCEDIGAEPVPVVPGGYNPHTQEAVPMEKMDAWVQDALDLIEFANGSEETHWGALRAEMGHKNSFHMKYIAIGNEEVGEAFWERYALFHRAIKKKYPEIKIINSAGPFAAGEAYEMGWNSARELGSDFVDEHYYNAPEWMIANHHHYDNKEKGVGVFLGEYASCGNAWRNALAEASYMIGLERNAGKVVMACYAPLFAHADYKNWDPDLIWFNSHQVSRSTSYYVQKLFMHNQGDWRLDCRMEGQEDNQEEGVWLEPYSDRFMGTMQWVADRCSVEISEIRVTEPALGKILEEIGGTVKANESFKMKCGDWRDRDISFRVRQLNQGRGFSLRFAAEDEENYYSIDFGYRGGGDLFLRGRRNGASFILWQMSSPLVVQCSSRIEVLIRGRHVRLVIDGKTYIEQHCPALKAEKLYYTASREGEKDIILKLANVTGMPRIGTIQLKGVEHAVGKVWRMQGYQEDACNRLGEPEQVVPSEEPAAAENGCLTFELEGRALAIYRLTVQEWAAGDVKKGERIG